jgi:glycolate oxidase iron-sulfur subunit
MLNDTTPLPSYDKLSARIDQAAQQCVKCGLCLPHCPTYQVAENENESPRGRIALMQGAVRKQVPITEKLLYHLDTCLACRACEAVCPAHVPYEELITSTRAWLTIKKLQKPLWIERILMLIFEHPRIRAGFAKLARFYPKYKLPQTKTIYNQKKITATQTKGHVLLLPSCANSVFDQQLARDAEHVLTQLGWKVTLPVPNYCCGALALHAGKLAEAQHCAEQQVTQWQATQPDFIVTLTNGCHATLQEYANAPLNVATPKIPLLTIEEFLLKEFNGEELKLNVAPQRVIVHTPCTLRNAIRKPNITSQLLQKIPGITCVPLPVSISGCCGAAGTYFLRHEEIAEQLVSPIIKFAQENSAKAFITTNIGCAMHINRALQDAHLQIPMLHPVTLIAQCL